jgi:(S)-ureidoglycine aminohydrolase
MPYPKGFLESRAIVKPGSYCVIPPEGRVINSIPGFLGCKLTIIASPKYGASFVQYVGAVEPGGRTTAPFLADPGIETFLYVLDGEGALTTTVGGQTETLRAGGYVFAPPAEAISFVNDTKSPVRILLYKQRFVPLDDLTPWRVFGSAQALKEQIYDQMENVFLQDFLPTDLAFDMNMHILKFMPSGCHPFVETHVQEHGAYVLGGQGMYLLGEDWVQIKKEDFIWFGPFVQQATYATGREPFYYIYSKDMNRDAAI